MKIKCSLEAYEEKEKIVTAEVVEPNSDDDKVELDAADSINILGEDEDNVVCPAAVVTVDENTIILEFEEEQDPEELVGMFVIHD